MAEAVPLPHHESGVRIDLLDDALERDTRGAAAGGAEVRDHGAVSEHKGGPVGGEQELVLVGLQSITRFDHGDGLVVRVRDHVDALAVAERPGLALPPGEDGLSAICLRAQVAGGLAGGQRAKPDKVAAVVENHRPVLAGPDERRREQVAGRARGSRGPVDGDDWRVQRGFGQEALRIRGLARAGGELGERNRRGLGDAEARREAHGAPADAQPRTNAHVLARREGGARNEARAGC